MCSLVQPGVRINNESISRIWQYGLHPKLLTFERLNAGDKLIYHNFSSLMSVMRVLT